MRNDAEERRASLLDYFTRQRARYVTKYQTAIDWVQRESARANALHFGRLKRGIER